MRIFLDRRFFAPLVYLGLAASAQLTLFACSASPVNNGSGGGSAATTGPGTLSATTTGSDGKGGDLGLAGGFPGTGEGGAPPTCNPGGPNDDVDGDSFTPMEGDCDDCDPFSNPNAVEVIAGDSSAPKDENCNGQTDEAPPPPCDQGIALDSLDPMMAPKSVELCKLSSGPKDWGVVSATWVLADGSPPATADLTSFHLGHGFFSAFGVNVKVHAGERMLALSSGSARAPTDPDYLGFRTDYTSNSPMGFPKESPACPGVTTGEPHDAVGVEVKIRAPSNAHGFSFDFDFFTHEWPQYICSKFNDFFVAILSPIPTGQSDGNVAFDKMGNPVSVNNAFLEVCGCKGNPPGACKAGGKMFNCSLGNTELVGTGFGFDSATDKAWGTHGATSWLQTTAPIEPGKEITIRWVVYDSSDGILDTTTLVDNWKWLATPGITVATNPIVK